MKSKEVIRQILEADPTGEVEVCVGNLDIHFIHSEPAYYDGPLQVIERDESKKGYNPVGGKYKREGDKVVIRTVSIRDCIASNPDTFKVDYSELSENDRIATEKNHDDHRK